MVPAFLVILLQNQKHLLKKHKDLINPIIAKVKSGAHSDIDKLSAKAREKTR
jgi:hypothetical protein